MSTSVEEEFDPLEEGASARADTAAKLRLENIISSYKDARDVLAEPVQNGMDAIVRADKDSLYDEDESPKITVTIDIDDDEIKIRDNGRGFPLNELRKYISPEGTDKRELFEDGDVRGHKGVGLSFLAYGFNYFQVKSKTPEEEPYRLIMEDSRAWVEGDEYDSDSRPSARVRSLEQDFDRGTEVLVKTDSMSNPSSLAHTFNSPEMTSTILETQTAIGIVPPRGEDHPDVEAELVYIKDGEEKSIELDDEYRYPHQKLNENLQDGDSQLDTVNIDEYDYDEDADDAIDGVLPSDQNCHHAVYKTFDTDEIKDVITSDHGGEELKEPDELREYIEEHDLECYVLFGYSNDYRNTLKERWGIVGNRKFHKPGIRIATDGMVSSWHSPVHLSYSSPRGTRLWYVYHFQSVRPDTGRKDFPQPVHDVVEDTKQTLHRRLVRNGKPFLAPATGGGNKGTETEDPPAVKAHRKDDISPDEVENFGNIPLEKEPNEEQDVVSLFNELIGMGVLTGFTPFYFSSVDAYDGYVEYDPDSVPSEVTDQFPGAASLSGRQTSITLEFKAIGSDIIKHIVNETRDWEEMDLLVCWELGGQESEDSGTEAQRSFGGHTITFREPTSAEERRYAGVTHIAHMSSKGDVALRTVSLKYLAENL